MWCCVVFCGVVWCGMVWCGVVLGLGAGACAGAGVVQSAVHWYMVCSLN